MHANVYHYKNHTVISTLVFNIANDSTEITSSAHWTWFSCFVNETHVFAQLFVNRPRERNSQSLSVCSQSKTLSYKPTQTATRSEFFQNKHSPTVSCASIYCMSHVHNVLEEVAFNTELNLEPQSSEVTPSSSRLLLLFNLRTALNLHRDKDRCVCDSTADLESGTVVLHS